MDQFVLYVLYARDKYGISLDDIEVNIEALSDGKCHKKIITERDITDVQRLITNSIGQMQSYLIDTINNIAAPIELFPKTPKIYTCNNCNFKALCFKST